MANVSSNNPSSSDTKRPVSNIGKPFFPDRRI